MRTKTPLQRIAVSLTTLVPLVFFVAGISLIERTAGGTPQVDFSESGRSRLKRNQVAFDGGTIVTDPAEPHSATAQITNPSCPPHFTKNRFTGECVLTSDAPLTKTIALSSNMRLNCQSHRLIPQTRGNATTRSIPEVAIFLNGEDFDSIQDAIKGFQGRIKNCVIDGFDFGIFAINSKRSLVNVNPPIQIFNNRINARFVGISLMSVDDAEINNNTLAIRTKGGRAIYVGRDSDRNRILNNQIGVKISVTDTTQVFRVPGPDFKLPSNPVVPQGSAVLITQIEGPEPSLLNAIIEGKLFQLTVTDSDVPNGDFSAGNRVEENTVTIFGGVGLFPVDGIVLAIPQGTLVSKNKVVGGRASIRVGIQTGTKQFPGTCKASGRSCLVGSGSSVDNDCRILGFDPQPLTDVCQGKTPKDILWVSNNTIIQDNLVVGPLEFGITTTGTNTLIKGNTITGPIVPTNPLTGKGIILIGKFALGNRTTVTRNSVKDVAAALTVIQSPPGQPPSAVASEFKANIFLNDFTGYNTAVLLMTTPTSPPPPPNYALSSELSVDLRGNFWGTLCSVGLDPSKVTNSDSPPTLNTFAVDSHPFGASVARKFTSLIACR